MPLLVSPASLRVGLQRLSNKFINGCHNSRLNYISEYQVINNFYQSTTTSTITSTPASRLLPKERLAGWVPNFADLSRHTPKFNTLRATVESLQAELSAGSLKSTQIIEDYQRSVCIYNEYLGAVYQLAPGAMERAREMDALRLAGKILEPLHGIPVLLKVWQSHLRTHHRHDVN